MQRPSSLSSAINTPRTRDAFPSAAYQLAISRAAWQLRHGLLILLVYLSSHAVYADVNQAPPTVGRTGSQSAQHRSAHIKPAKIQLSENSENQLVANGIKGSLQGERTREYLFAANTGQQLQLDILSDHALVGFRITAPASTRALHESRGRKSSYSVTLPRDGTYRIVVFLTEAAAKKEERADFTLNIRISNPG
ncbi:hypothetical protein [Microbulbifer agarilyticus]|uniref:hypothetical protein n=1 Tax=Microbulbifer agarilyticus TaxID=260552 RepID=UPI001CD3AF73|nr:hypothetical protein [Microbulbifer agarilyticus]MCA0892267.1 hypothetical protein [Microbulbifer agarilyticus]